MTDVVIASAARTAIRSYGRGRASVPPSDLGAVAAVAALELRLVTLCIGGGQGIAMLLGRG
jgi:acetyl-CoA acetyltransferase